MGTVFAACSKLPSRLLNRTFVGLSQLLLLIFLASNGLSAAPANNSTASAPAVLTAAPELQTGFRFLYEQNFPEARHTFFDWEEGHPDDPLGHAALAASYLFEEFYRQGVLSSGFFLDDEELLRGIRGTPDPSRLKAFNAAIDRTRTKARARMAHDTRDPEAIFALALASGMQADALAILEHKQSESVRYIKEAKIEAERLPVRHPEAADAWLALGAAHYIIVCLPRSAHFLLWFGGIHGDRNRGMEELDRTATDGLYLKPFAKIMLALAARREGRDGVARDLLCELSEEFPSSPLFAIEYARVTAVVASAGKPQ
jgi:hypothetical protein